MFDPRFCRGRPCRTLDLGAVFRPNESNSRTPVAYRRLTKSWALARAAGSPRAGLDRSDKPIAPAVCLNLQHDRHTYSHVLCRLTNGLHLVSLPPADRVYAVSDIGRVAIAVWISFGRPSTPKTALMPRYQ
jgi:hypothetical protein